MSERTFVAGPTRGSGRRTPPEHDAGGDGDTAAGEMRGRRLLLASVSRQGSDGVAHVARLLERAIRELTGVPAQVIDLEPARGDGVSLRERLRFAAGLIGRQAAARPDLVVFSHLSVARAQRTVPPAVRRPYVIFLHGIEAWGAPLPEDRLSVLRGAAALLSNSHYTARRFERMYPDLAPVMACPLALLPSDSDAVSDPRDEAVLGNVRPNSVLIVGRMSAAERYKGHDELLDVWPVVRESVADAQLVIAGGGDDAARLAARSRELGLADSVFFTGRVSDSTLAALYERCAAFGMPSRGEGFGIVYLEAMRAGRPCLASLEDGGAEVVVDGETGLLVPRSDPAALAAAVVALLSNREMARAMGAAGRVRFEREFSFERFRENVGRALTASSRRLRSGAR